MSIGTDIYDRALAAMDDFIGRVVRAQRMSGVMERGSLKSIREEYRAASAQQDVKAHEVLARFVRVAQDYYERARSNVTYVKQWTRYEDQRLRRPIKRLVQLQAESQKWQALRRLQSPASLVQLPNGQSVALADWGERPLFDTIA